jgi:outer membrane murein-binding lipoprotein Lpp
MKNMRGLNYVIAALAASVVLLSGCTSPMKNMDDADDPIDGWSADATVAISFSETTGLITKYIDEDGNVLFDEGSNASDYQYEGSPQYGVTISGPDESIEVEDFMDIDGKSYSVSSAINISFRQDLDQQITFFNQNVASPESFDIPTPPGYTVDKFVKNHIISEITTAVKDGQLPKVQYTLNGNSHVHTDTRIAQAWADNKSAQQAAEIINGNMPKGEFYYSFSCAEYGITANSDQLSSAIQTMYEDIDLGVKVYAERHVVMAETAQPCAAEVKYVHPKDSSRSNPPPPVNSRLNTGDPGMMP